MKKLELNINDDKLTVIKKKSRYNKETSVNLNEIRSALVNNELILNDLRKTLELLEKDVYFNILHDYNDCNYDNDVLIDNIVIIE